MIVLGIDPDTKSTGVGLVKDKRAIHARLIAVENRRAKVQQRIPAMVSRLETALRALRLDQPEASRLDVIVIESQRHRPGTPVRVQDLIHLAQVTGAAAGICRSLWPSVQIVLPEPKEWKGTVPKAIFTRRILRNLGLEAHEKGGIFYLGTGVRVPGTPGLTKADSSHVIDGLGLALWGHLDLS